MARIVLHPAHPERICWGCSQFCRSDDLACGNGGVRTPHPQEIFGSDWAQWAEENEIEMGGPDPSQLPVLEQKNSPCGEDCQPFVQGAPCKQQK